jgi:hypothetical protein
MINSAKAFQTAIGVLVNEHVESSVKVKGKKVKVTAYLDHLSSTNRRSRKLHGPR